MKKVLFAVAVTSMLAACGSNPAKQAQVDYERQEKLVTQSVDKAPEWMFKLPKSPNAVYENGTSVSLDFSMADMKAKAIAYAKICTAAGGRVRSQTKVYRADNEGASVEQSEMVIRSMCPDVDITGVETVEMKHVAEGNRIRSYVLVALPIGAGNVMKSTKEAKERAPEAFKELDEVTTGKKSEAPAKKSDTVSTNEGEFKLLEVDNEAYKQKRAEALEKPGAVVGQVTVH